MKYLVNIETKTVGAETNSVNAKELHTFIQSKTRFNDWIKNRIKKYGFIENQDYIIVETKTAGRPLKEYYITLDMAKELSMVENNEKGREARRWFIEIAKRHFSQQPSCSELPKNSNLKELQEIILKQNALIAAKEDTNINKELQQKMKQQLSLIVSQVGKEIMTRFEESLDVTSRSFELQKIQTTK